MLNLILFLFLLVIISIVIHKKMTNPFTLFSIPWFVVLGSYSTGIEPSMLEIHGLVKIALALVFLIFFFFSVLGYKTCILRADKVNRLSLPLSNKIIIALLAISFFSLCFNIFHTIRSYDSLASYFLSANLIYSDRVDGAGSVFHKIPYLTYLSYACLCLGFYDQNGNYNKKIVFSAAIILIVDGIFLMGRASIIMCVFALLAPIIILLFWAKFLKKIKYILGISFFLILVLFSTNELRSSRGGLENYRVPDNPVIEFLMEVGIYTPSIYVYLSAPVVVLSETIINNDSKELTIPFKNSMTPVSRMIFRPFDIEFPRYEQEVNIGFRNSNTGGYLKDIFLDFGILGLFVSSAILAFIFGRIFKRAIYTPNQMTIAWFAVFLPLILMGPIINYLRTPYFLIGVLMIFTINFIKKCKR